MPLQRMLGNRTLDGIPDGMTDGILDSMGK
jgi:hypothetical protein